jgi:hypothetical protein
VDRAPYHPIECLLDILFDLSNSLVYELGSVAASFGSSGEALPEYRLCDFALRLGAHAIVYPLLRVLVRVIAHILPNALGLVVDSSVEIILVVGVIR